MTRMIMNGILVLMLSGLASGAWAAAILEYVSGDVTTGPNPQQMRGVAKDERIQAGSYIATGPKSIAVLAFDDGQKTVLNENTEFRITSYAFSQDKPAEDKFVFALLKGAMRSVTSLLTRRNPSAYALHTTQATIGIRGTEFMVALVNPAYFSITNGIVSITNATGTVTFGAGTTLTVTAAGAAPVTIAASALPASVQATFAQLQSIAVSAAGAGAGAGAGGAGASGAAGAAAGGGLTAGVVGAAALVGAAVTVAGKDEKGVTTGTTGTTGP